MKKRLLFMSLIIMLFSFIIQSENVQAATPYMKKLNVKWDLEENTWTTIRTNWAGDVWIKSRAMIKNIKIKNSKKDGYKQLTCDIFFERFKLSKSQVKKYYILNITKNMKILGVANVIGGYMIIIMVTMD